MAMKKISLISLAVVILLIRPAAAQEDNVKIKITINDKIIMATMDNNPTAHDFISLLPMTLSLEDYNKTEKVSDLPKMLTKEKAPAAVTPKAGDIAFYAPWGNLAIFYKDFSRSPGLIKLGRIDAGLDALNVAGPVKATFEILKTQGE